MSGLFPAIRHSAILQVENICLVVSSGSYRFMYIYLVFRL